MRVKEQEQEVRVRLTDADIVDRAQELAAKVQHVKILRRKRREDLRAANALIESELDEIERLAGVITDQQELRKQGELFVDQATAETVLAEVGKAACTCPPGDAPLIDCPLHGEDAPRAESTAALHASLERDELDAADLADEEDDDGEAEDDDDGDEDDEDETARIAQAADVAEAALGAAGGTTRGKRGPQKRGRAGL